jgi:hypothetical protein
MGRLAAVGFRKGRRGGGVWQTESGWFRAVSTAHPWAVEGPFPTRGEAEQSGRAPMVGATQGGVA